MERKKEETKKKPKAKKEKRSRKRKNCERNFSDNVLVEEKIGCKRTTKNKNKHISSFLFARHLFSLDRGLLVFAYKAVNGGEGGEQTIS